MADFIYSSDLKDKIPSSSQITRKKDVNQVINHKKIFVRNITN